MRVEEYLNYTESRMAKYFKEIKIVSEANLPYTDYIKILENFKKILSHHIDRQGSVVKFIWNLAPRTALLLTVNFAIYNYDGNFWGKFKKDISLLKDNEWKVNFLRQIELEKLELFDKNSNQKYVENILGHAGIPKNNIAGFIKNVIDPAASFDLTAHEVIESVKREKNDGSVVKTYGLYKSVKDFIKLDNSVSNSLISRCIEVWREQERPFTEKYRNYLPDHILDEFEKYTSKEVTTKIQQSRQQRLSRPVLSYSTQYQNVFINLPIQRFSNKEKVKVEWKITSDDNSIILPTKMYIFEEEQEYIVDKKNGEYPVSPLNDYIVHLLINGEIKGEWSFYLDQVAVFDTGSYEQLNKKYLSNSNLLLIVHESEYEKIKNCKNDHLVRPLFKEWQGYYEIDLYVDKSDTIEFSNTILRLNPLRNLMELEGTRVAHAKAETAVYTDEPMINIHSDISSLNEDLARWSLKLYHPYSKTTVWKKISELEYEQSTKGIKINLKNLLNNKGELFGKYLLSLTGVLGHDQSIDFHYISRKDFSFSVLEQEMNVSTSPNIDFTIPTIFDVEKKSETKTSFNVPNHPDFVRGNLLNLTTKEKLDLKLYSSKVSCELVTSSGAQELGIVFNANEFDFAETHVLLDLENPSLLNSGKAVAVTLMERLKTGEFARKTVNCRVGRKHVLDLNYFDGLHETSGKRTIGLTIAELEITEKVVTVETEWVLNSVIAPSSDNECLSFNCSFQPEKLKARIWSFNPQKELFMEREVVYPAHSLQITEENLPDGYYFFELCEVEEDDFFDIFDEVIYPSSLDNHKKFFKVERKIEVPTFVEWLLMLDSDGEEKEWEIAELEKLLIFMWDRKAVIEPLLLSDYNLCCDFGLQNIDLLLDIIKKEEKNEFASFICKIAGYQEWDPASFNSAMQNRLEKVNPKALYTPENISMLSTLSRRERAISFQRKIKKGQFIKGFSIHHEYLSFFDQIDNEETYQLRIKAFYINHKNALDNVLVSLNDLQLLSRENINRLNTRRIASSNSLYSFPFYVGLSALVCALIIEHESKMDSHTLFALRQAIPALYEIAEDWYLHDLVHWKDKLVGDRRAIIILQERKQAYGNPSFTWKE
ncbi:hypothetical protein [Planococcus shixiaomingii]|uniref:hypothetical protein n=1 Tax=Planococcus shixiaomingii TaxID=3058393 RepID=UPI002615F72F|nr:hypothetical protein [Planococcus sp. N022]WKA53186.1 hypothetical protein QWY21_10990 [Planococcus sp. N022]